MESESSRRRRLAEHERRDVVVVVVEGRFAPEGCSVYARRAAAERPMLVLPPADPERVAALLAVPPHETRAQRRERLRGAR